MKRCSMESIRSGQETGSESFGQSMPGTLGVVAETRAWRHDGGVFMTTAIGRVVDELSPRFSRVLLTLPVAEGAPTPAGDHRLRASNVEIVPQPFYSSSLAALRRPVSIARAYYRLCRDSDYVFVRGMPPYSGLLYLIARATGRKPCHWIVGDPVALLRSHRRAGFLKDTASLAYTYFDRVCTRLGSRLAGGSFICNGRELGEIYHSPRTHVTASSTVTDDEFFVREDTCQGPVIRILFVGFLRPEKGVEYLLEAVGRMKAGRPWELILVGSGEHHEAYGRKLRQIVERLGIADRLSWPGHIPAGARLYELMRQADILVLPTLSEGTPHVLVEARANSLPVVASRVGGVPTSVTDGVDGLLVPPKDPDAIAWAIDRIVEQPELRRSLIREGLQAARRLTVHAFVGRVVEVLGGSEDGEEGTTCV